MVPRRRRGSRTPSARWIQDASDLIFHFPEVLCPASCLAVKYCRVMPQALDEGLGTRVGRAGCVLLLSAVLVTAIGCSAIRPGVPRGDGAAGTPGTTGSASSSAGAGPVAVPRGRLIPVTVAEALPHLADSAAASQEIDFGNVAGALAVDGRPSSKTSLRWVVGQAENNLDS